MATTTIRVDSDTHARLVEMSSQTGSSLIDTVRDAGEALRRQRFAHRVAKQLEDLSADPDAWADYLADAEATAASDGIS